LTLTLSTPWMHADLESIACKFGDDPAICLRVEAIFAKVYRRTDRRRTPRDCISSWNELKTWASCVADCVVSGARTSATWCGNTAAWRCSAYRTSRRCHAAGLNGIFGFSQSSNRFPHIPESSWKSSNFFPSKFKALKVLENRVGTWKSLNLSFSGLGSAGIF